MTTKEGRMQGISRPDWLSGESIPTMSNHNSRVLVTVGKHQYTLWSAAGSIDASVFPEDVAAYVPATALPSGSEDFIERARKRIHADDVWNSGFDECEHTNLSSKTTPIVDNLPESQTYSSRAKRRMVGAKSHLK